MLLTIHDANLQKVAFVDNSKQNTLNYYNDTWSRDMPTGSSTFEFTVFKKAIQSDTASSKAYQHLNERAWVSFRHNGRTYLFNVMSVEENEQTIKCYCENLNLELINELVNPYKATRAMTFAEYCKEMALLNYAHLTIGINEISDQQRTLEWTTQETKLARLLNLAKQFNAEIEFDTELKADSTIKKFTVNIYHEHDDTHQGVGRIRNDVVLKYGKNISSINRKVDKTGIFNTIRPTGKMPTVEVEDSGERHLSSQRVKNADGSTTETIIRTASDGTKSKTIVHTKVTKLADKTRITTTTTTRSDGSIEQTVTTSKKGGPSNTEKRIIKPPKKKEKETEPEKEVLTIENLGDWSIKNERGELEFYQRGQQLYAPLSMQLYPSTFTSATAEDQWTRRDFDFDTDEPNELRRLAYLKLKQHCYPAITYEVDGFVDVEIGDTIQIYDDGFSPALIVKARVTEQKISFTNPASNKTTFANFKALENKLSDGIQAAFERLFEASKPYTIKLATDNGVAFKNGQGQTIVTPTLMKGNKVINSGWRWVVDGVIKATSSSYIVKAADINQKMVLTVSAWNDNKEVASEQLTLINMSDGLQGPKGDTGPKGDPGPKGDRGEKGALDENQLKEIKTSIDSKADQGLTQEQLNALNEKAGIIQAELEAKASADILDNWIKAYKDFVNANETARAQAEKDLISASQRVSNIAKDLGELSDRWNFIDTYMSSSNEGLVIGKNDGSSSMMFNPNGRISMFSAGVEVMYISQGVIHIENGIFSKTIQIGRFREEQYHINPDMNVIRYVGGS